MNAINLFLKSVLDGIHTLIPSYGWSIVAFTILVRLCLMPLDYKSRVGMRKMSKLAPKQQELQKKYEKDPDKMQRKLAELYQKEKVSPMSSCWPLLVSMPIMIAMFTAMRMMANEQLVQQTFDIFINGAPTLEPFLWIKNLWMPDSPFNWAWPSADSLRMIEAREWLAIFNTLSEESIAALSNSLGLEALLTQASFEGDALKTTIELISTKLVTLPSYIDHAQKLDFATINLLITQLTLVVNWNGLYLLPLMSAGSQFLMTKLTPNQQPQPAGTSEQAQQQAATGGFMKWFFPLFSLYLCSSYNAAFALYWVTSNLIAIAQNYGINKYLDLKEKRAAENPVSADKAGNGVK